MKTKSIVFSLIIFSILTTSCKSCKEKAFEQPTIEVTGYSLKELPGEYTYLEIDMLVHNNDDREAHIKNVEYQVEIEGITSETETETIDKDILTDTPLELTLPLTLLTNDAIKLLAKLDAGELLNYHATGTFHVDDPIIKLFDLAIDVSGTADVEAGFEDFYEKPEITLENINGTYKDNGNTYTFDFDITTGIQNTDTRGITADKVEYTVTVAGKESEPQTYTSEFIISGNGSISLTLPMSMILNSADGETLANAVNSGSVQYSVEGKIHVIKIDETTSDFILPLYITGTTEIDLRNFFTQPTIEITGYTLLELPGDYTNLTIDMTLTNNDTRSAYITDVNYQVDIDGVMSQTENELINQTLTGSGTLDLTLPLTLLTDDAVELLTRLDAGETLPYHATGIFHINDPILELFDFPIDITGNAIIDVGFDDFYQQPETTVNSFSGTYTSTFTTVTFNLMVDCTVQNMDSRAVDIDQVEYIVTVEGVVSNTHFYNTPIFIAGNGSINLNLPVTLTVPIAQSSSLISALSDGYANYIVEGTFHAVQVDGGAVDFVLPLYDEGTAPVTSFSPGKK